MNVSEFLAMGGYAAFVWPSFGLTLIVLICNVRARQAPACRVPANRRCVGSTAARKST